MGLYTVQTKRTQTKRERFCRIYINRGVCGFHKKEGFEHSMYKKKKLFVQTEDTRIYVNGDWSFLQQNTAKTNKQPKGTPKNKQKTTTTKKKTTTTTTKKKKSNKTK